jgi:hypothetical protein
VEEVVGCKRKPGRWAGERWGPGECRWLQWTGAELRREGNQGKDCILSAPHPHLMLPASFSILAMNFSPTSSINCLITGLIKDAESKQQEGNLFLITV